MTTDVEFVNRVRRKLREGDVSSTSDDFSTAILDEVNTAMRDILESRIWDFDIRSASHITQPAFGATQFTIASGEQNFSASVTADDTQGATASGNHTLRVFFTGSDDDAITMLNVAFRVEMAQFTGIFESTGIIGNLAEAWPYSEMASTGLATFFVAEYQFPLYSNDGPSKVRQLLSMTYQQRELALEQISRQDFDRIVTRPHDSVGLEPTTVYTGFDAIETGSVAGAPEFEYAWGSTDYAPSFGIWPVPTPPTRLDYTYVLSHLDISSTQELEEVPRAIEDQIVWLAYARVMQSGVGNEVENGYRIEQSIFSRLDEIYSGKKRDPVRRITVRPYGEDLRDPANFGVLPKNVGSL